VNKHLVFTGFYGFNVARQFTGGNKVGSTFVLYMGARLCVRL